MDNRRPYRYAPYVYGRRKSSRKLYRRTGLIIQRSLLLMGLFILRAKPLLAMQRSKLRARAVDQWVNSELLLVKTMARFYPIRRPVLYRLYLGDQGFMLKNKLTGEVKSVGRTL